MGSVVAFAGVIGPSVPPGPAQPSSQAGTTSPIEAWGWMACDGRMLAICDYCELYEALGLVYGGALGADGKDGTFAIPDYRGYFMRGMGGVPEVDPERGARKAAPGGAASGIGSTQDFAVQTHEHNYLESQGSAPGQEGEAGAPGPTTKKTQGGPVTTEGASPDVKVSPKETRPVNIYVNFIIKFTAGGPRVPV